MTREEIVSKIEPIAQKVFMQPSLVIDDNLSAATVPTWTSLTFTQFLTELEGLFAIKFKMMEILKMKNMGAIIDTVVSHLK
ncbi:MAG: acyl carrier protein [Bacteroidales bacterium]|nr:acyl carrier protein [Bacteroidales bacterium]